MNYANVLPFISRAVEFQMFQDIKGWYIAVSTLVYTLTAKKIFLFFLVYDKKTTALECSTIIFFS